MKRKLKNTSVTFINLGILGLQNCILSFFLARERALIKDKSQSKVWAYSVTTDYPDHSLKLGTLVSFSVIKNV